MNEEELITTKEEPEKAEVINIEYERPKLAHRVLANFIDILLMVMVTIFAFVGSRAAVQSTSMYRDNDYKIKTIEISSCLFINERDVYNDFGYKYGDEVTIITTWLPRQDTLTYKDMVGRCQMAIDGFLSYMDTINHEVAIKASNFYDEQRLAFTGNVPGHEHYFEKNEVTNEIFIPVDENNNPYYSHKTYFEEFYRKIIDNNFVDDYLTKEVPNFRTYLSNEGKYLIFIELPIAFVVGAILVYFIPPLFFRRGRMTLGKALYRIGLVDSKIFSPTFPRFLARFAIFFFAEMVLSIFTFGAPFLISFTMMLVTKTKRGFPDYLLGLTEIDASKQKIYYNKIDALSDKVTVYKTPTDFRLP